MRKHQRQLIREAAKAALLGKTVAGERVYETRMIPYRRLELPAIAVYALDEEVDPESARTAPRELTRNLDLAIEGVVLPGDNVDDALDALALQVEIAMHADETLGGAAADAVLTSTEIGILIDGEKEMGVVTLTYDVRYYTYAPDGRDVELDDFETADIRTSLGGDVEEEDQAHDRLEGLGE